MAGARHAHVGVAPLLGQRLEQRLDLLEAFGVAADHHAVALLQAPDAARDAGVQEEDALLLCLGRTALRVAEVRVAAVDDDVAVLEQREERLEGVLGRRARRDHQPDDPRLLELAGKLDERVGRPLRRRPRVRLDRMALAAQPLGHVPAHPSEPHHPDFHAASSGRPGPRRQV